MRDGTHITVIMTHFHTYGAPQSQWGGGSSFTSTAEKKDGEIADSLRGSVIDIEKKELHFNVRTGKKAKAAQAGSCSPTDDGADDDRPHIPEVVVQVWEQLKGAGGIFFFLRQKSIIKRCHWFSSHAAEAL